MQDQNPKKPYGKAARILALIAALFVIIGTIFAVFQPKRDGSPAAMIPTARAQASDAWKDLKKGMSGREVRLAQAGLSALGYYSGKQDGNFSKAFEEAVLAFQKDWGLAETGVLDRDAYDLITADLPKDVPTASPTPVCNSPTPVPIPGVTMEPTAFVVRGESYSDKDSVAAYLRLYGELPPNYITKQEAAALGWVSSQRNLWQVAPGKSIGGDRFGNYEGQLPTAKGRKYYECDIDYYEDYLRYDGARNEKRIIYSNDGLIFYTGDHYQTYEEIK